MKKRYVEDKAVYAEAENSILEGLQFLYGGANGGEAMPDKLEAMAGALTALLVDAVMSLDTIARSAQMVVDKLEQESVAND